MLKRLSKLLKRLSILSHLPTVRKISGRKFKNCFQSRHSVGKAHLLSSPVVSDLLQLSTRHLIDRAEGYRLGGAAVPFALQPETRS